MRLLTVSEVAETLAISKSLVYQLVERGEITYVSVGTAKGYRFDPQDLIEFIQSRKVCKKGEDKKPSRPRLKHIRLS